MSYAIPPPYSHQVAATKFWLDNPRMLNFSGCGTGKTRATLDAIVQRGKQASGRVLVFAPLSILKPAWGDDIERWTPQLSYNIAYAKNRAKAFSEASDIVITNHDAVKWVKAQLDEDPHFLDAFNTLIIDESTAFKNGLSARSKAMNQIRQHFNYRVALSGTPNPRTILDIFHQVLLIDDGEHLGKSFFHFRNEVCTPEMINGYAEFKKWIDKPDAQHKTAMALADITFRVELEECIEMPEQISRTLLVEMPPAVRKHYKLMEKEAMMLLDSGEIISAVHAGAKNQKILQLLSGSVYNANGDAKLIFKERYELVMDLVKEVEQSVVGFNWRHERDELMRLAERDGIAFACIDGSTSPNEKIEACAAFQRGELQVLFCQPQSAGHGLTLTKGTRTIWSTPLYNAEFYDQFNHRIYRAGQKRRTEIIHILTKDSIEERVFDVLQGRMDAMDVLLSLAKKGK